MEKEKTIWKGNPSQWTNFGVYTICLLLCWLIIPIFIALWKFLVVKNWKIEITDQRIIEIKGVLSRTTNELELYRVKDIKLEEPFFLRLVGLSNVVMETSDKSDPIATIPAIKNGNGLRNMIRTAVENRRDTKGVRETDFQY